MKILVITDFLWNNYNSVGNTYSNIFENMEDIDIANICLQEGRSSNIVSQKCLQTSEWLIVKHILSKESNVWINEEKNGKEEGNFKISKGKLIFRTQINLWVRELIWLIGAKDKSQLYSFVDEVKPDIIFAQVQSKMYMNGVIRHVHARADVPLFLYMWDDIYSLKRLSASPLFWIDRFLQRRSIRNLVKKAIKLYLISKEQIDEYRKYFNIECGLLYKTLSCIAEDEKQSGIMNGKIRIVYTGNLYCKRWKTMQLVAEAISKIDFDNKVELQIYTGTKLTKHQRKRIVKSEKIKYMGAISENEVKQKQTEADILLHVEPFGLKNALSCRLSFSTKLVDYMDHKKCIIAIGSNVCSSMMYLKRNDAAYCIDNRKDIGAKLLELLSNSELIERYATNAWNCGLRNHNRKEMQRMLRMDFDRAIKNI